MKTKVTTNELAHLWANKVQSHASAGSFYFDYDSIYSYGGHFCIAKHITNDKGENAVLFTTRGYSNSTAKHISKTRQAITNQTIIYCNDPAAGGSHNFDSWLKDCESVAKSLVNARKPEIYLNQIAVNLERAKKYADFLGLKVTKELKEFEKLLNSGKLKDYQKTKEDRENKAAVKKLKEDLKKFFSYEIDYIYSKKDIDAYVRISQDLQSVETSKGVTVDAKEAKILYQLIQRGADIKGRQISHYTVISINGHLKIGCHDINIKNMHEVGAKLLAL